MFQLKVRSYGVCPSLPTKNPETPIQKNLCTPMFIAAQFTIAKYWKQPRCPSANEWIKKLWYIYIMEFYGTERKKEPILFATAWMEPDWALRDLRSSYKRVAGRQKENGRMQKFEANRANGVRMAHLVIHC